MTRTLSTPPNNTMAEQSVLGALLQQPGSWDRVADLITDQDFYRADHRLLFSVIRDLCDAGKDCDALIVAESLDKAGKLADAGGHDYLGSLADNIPSAANIRTYAHMVREASIQRQVIEICRDAAATAQNPADHDVQAIIAEAQARLDALGQARTGRDVSASEASKAGLNLLGEMEARREAGSDAVGIPTGIPMLDRAMTLLGPRLIVVAARPGVGKTAFALQSALHAAQRGYRIGIVSLEMGIDELATRAMACRHQIDFGLMMRGEENATKAAGDRECSGQAFAKLPIRIDTDTTTLSGILARVSRWKREHQIDLVIVDYIGLIEAPGNNQRERLGMVSRALKRQAKRLGIPIMALAQLNRSPERENRYPQLSDLRDCGDIEQDADVVLMLHAKRRDVVDGEGDQEAAVVEADDDATTVNFGLLKNRTGHVCWLNGKFVFRGRFQRFEEQTRFSRVA